MAGLVEEESFVHQEIPEEVVEAQDLQMAWAFQEEEEAVEAVEEVA
jgi:hypothetical protein